MALTKALGGSGGGGSAPDVKEEGSTVQSAANALNFTSSLLTAASNGTGGATVSTSSWLASHPDTPPSSPTLFGGVNYNLEFPSLTTGTMGGADIGSPPIASSVVNGLLRVNGGTSGTADIKGREWAVPSGNFTLTAKIIRYAFGATFWVGGPFLRANASGAGNIELAYSVATGSSYESGGRVGSGRYSALTTRASISTEQVWPFWQPIYHQLTYNGTNVIHSVSYSGHPDSFVAIVTDSLATALGGTAPGRFGLAMDSFSASFAGIIYCQWIRFT